MLENNLLYLCISCNNLNNPATIYIESGFDDDNHKVFTINLNDMASKETHLISKIRQMFYDNESQNPLALTRGRNLKQLLDDDY